jgi:hypothetical protein
MLPGDCVGFKIGGGNLTKSLISLVSAEEVTLSRNFNGLRWLTCRNGAIEPQKLFPAVANRNSHLKFTD